MTQSNHPHREFLDVEPDIGNIQRRLIYGQTPEEVHKWIYPQVIFTLDISGGVKLENTMTQIGPLRSLITKIGRYKLGDGFSFTSFENSYWMGKTTPMQRYRLIDVTPPSNQRANFTVWINITPDAHAEIIRNESDHLNDFEYAFELSCERVAKEINKLAGVVYKKEKDAIQQLVQALEKDARQLIPKDPTDLNSWETYLQNVADQLTTQSANRDKEEKGGDHLAVGYTATFENENVYLTPKSKEQHRNAREIIKLEEVPVVFDPSTLSESALQRAPAPRLASVSQPATLISGSMAKLKANIKVFVYFKEEGARTNATKFHEGAAAESEIKANTKVTIVDVDVTRPGSKLAMALVSFDKEAESGVDPDFFSVYETETFFFWVDANSLIST